MIRRIIIMRILSNVFPENLPDSEKISQGGPSYFADNLVRYLVTHTNHSWCGVVFSGEQVSKITVKKVFTFRQREFYKMSVPKIIGQKIYRAVKENSDPEEIMKKPIKEILGLIKIVKPDVIFLNGFGIYNWAMLKAGVIAKIPVVIQHAGIATKELSINRDLFTKKARALRKKMEKDATELASHEIFLNEWSRDCFTEIVSKPDPQKTSVVPLPFDFEAFKKVPQTDARLFNYSKDKIHFGVIGRWEKLKNHRAILRLAKKTKEKGLNWVFHSVVEIPEGGKDGKTKKDYVKNVDIVGRLDRSGILQFDQALDLLLVPSLFDVSPTVVLEAIAAGTPVVISTNVGFISEFKKNGAQKWIVDFSDPESALKKIKKLVGVPMPKALVREIKKNHASKKVFEQYLRIFESVTVCGSGNVSLPT